MERVAWIGIGALLCACGGTAIIDAEAGAGAGVSTASSASNMGGGGNAGTSSTGGGGLGGDASCIGENIFIAVAGDGPDQLYQAAGPDPERTQASAQIAYSDGGAHGLEVKGCASNASTNACITLSGADIDAAGDSTGQGRIEYTSENGIVFLSDVAALSLAVVEPVGGVIGGSYDGQVFANGGADGRFLSGSFSVCRVPDL